MQNCPECETLIYNNTIAAPSLALTPQAAAPVACVATDSGHKLIVRTVLEHNNVMLESQAKRR
jgi:hypothetical protein